MAKTTPEERRSAILTIEAIGTALERLGAVPAATLYAKLVPPADMRFKQFVRLLEGMQAAGLIAEMGGGRLLWKGPKTPAKPAG